MWDKLSAHLIDVVQVLINIPLNVGEKFYFVYVLTFIGLAYISFRLYHRKDNKSTDTGLRAQPSKKTPGNKGTLGTRADNDAFLHFLFPKAIYTHKSARIDYGIFLINLLISPILLVGAGLQAWLSIQVAAGLVALNQGEPVFAGEWSTGTYLLFILGYTLAADLSVYLIHRFHHQSDVFWPLHALHHSAVVITPVTLFRKHPLWIVLANLLNLTLTVLFQGAFVFVFYGGPGFEVLFGINSVYVLYNFFGANLRHSHIWLSWGKPVSYLFISPAMHQIHHDPTRMDKNYGEVFALWDWIFGSLYVPRGFETFDIGLGTADNPHDSLVKAYYVPIRESWKALRKKFHLSD